MPKLSDTQSVLLSTAAARPDRSILPVPETLQVKGAALQRTLKALLRRGLIAESSAGERGESSKRVRAGNEDNHSDTLIITSAGLNAIGIEQGKESDRNPTAETAPVVLAVAKPHATRPGGKMGLMLDMVSYANGATIDELATQAGWLPHTTRAALTRLRQRGYDIQLTAAGDRRAYRLGVAG